MLTLNTRQLRALAAVAPGTLLLTNDSMQATTFLTADDDRERSGVWAIAVDQDGNVTESLTQGRGEIVTSYPALMAAETEAAMEALA
jgi:hypothetical protein